MKIISIREFQQNLYKYIKAKEDFVVTIKNVVAFEVGFNVDNVTTKSKNVVTKPKDVVTLDTPEEVAVVIRPRIKVYGCGCQKMQGDLMCAKHNRL